MSRRSKVGTWADASVGRANGRRVGDGATWTGGGTEPEPEGGSTGRRVELRELHAVLMLLAGLEEVGASAVMRPGALARDIEEVAREVSGAGRLGAVAGENRGAVEAASERMEGSSVDMVKNARRRTASRALSGRNNNRSQRAQQR
jgi:hypothetical protein